MPRNGPPGCLAALFPWLFGSSDASAPTFPYKLSDSFLTPAEASFYRVLRPAVGEAYVICPKVNLGDLFFVPRPHENRAALNRIDRRHVDFVLCDPENLRPT